MDFNEALKLVRAEKGITQNEASKLVGISRSYFADLESGRYLPSGRVMLKLDEAFNIFYLLKNDGKTIHDKEVN